MASCTVFTAACGENPHCPTTVQRRFPNCPSSSRADAFFARRRPYCRRYHHSRIAAVVSCDEPLGIAPPGLRRQRKLASSPFALASRNAAWVGLHCLSLIQRLHHLRTLAKGNLDMQPRTEESGKGASSNAEDEEEDGNEDENENGRSDSLLGDVKFLRTVSLVDSADAALALIAERGGEPGRVLSNEECSILISSALAVNNDGLAYSIIRSMRTRSSLAHKTLDSRSDEKALIDVQKLCWNWPHPDVSNYAALVRGLAATLRVSDAIQTILDVRRRGIPVGEEVPFGKVVSCPTCKVALVVVQPQHGTQLVACCKCCYQYELMSGDVISCESESISPNISIFERGLRMLRVKKQPLPSAVHSIVVRAPDNLGRTYKFATNSADLPAQEGDRVTVAAAAPMNAGRFYGPLRVSGRAPGRQASEPMAITNHASGRMTELLRAPPKDGSGAAVESSFIIPAALLLATGDAVSTFIDPALPRTIAVTAALATALGTAANTLVLPQLNKISQRAVDLAALRQQLLQQYDFLQKRLDELTKEAAEEVRMLARMCQLQNKMEAVGEITYSSRIKRVREARKGLDERLLARLEFIDRYAKLSSMIEIEVEMDTDVVLAESAGAAANIADQIERLMEVEDLQKQWKVVAEANDEVERLLQSSPSFPSDIIES